jgi:murein endopeptidase
MLTCALPPGYRAAAASAVGRLLQGRPESAQHFRVQRRRRFALGRVQAEQGDQVVDCKLAIARCGQLGVLVGSARLPVGNPMNPGLVSDLTPLLRDVDLWLHGYPAIDDSLSV